MKKDHKPKNNKGFELQEFCRRLNCFEASDLVLFFDKVRGKKQKFEDWNQEYYVREKILKFIDSPMRFFMGLDTYRAEQFYAFIMYEWNGDWRKIYEKRVNELKEAEGMTKDILDAVGLNDVKEEELGTFEDKLRRL